MKGKYTFYNLIFPLWSFFLIPIFWIVILPLNFLVDSLVLLLAFRLCRVEAWKQQYWSRIGAVFGLGFGADFVAAGLLFALSAKFSLSPDWVYDPFSSIGAFLYISVGVVLAAFLIYWWNLYALRKEPGLSEQQSKKIALLLAILTAPYTMYLPTTWFV